ncbi:glycosyltransferase [Mangrovibacterium lignilyticum]|uniref:glycosyltransferase n=1 Tax=Mangrovibacterium lignilyticum TaxID=2668052 RepID=UPI0013D21E37|nr:glycosyltransferase [Mangrovibacterium lignilyticum]
MGYQKATLIISVYNNTTALTAVLESLKLQTNSNFELIISEDAEHEEMRCFIRDYDYQGELNHLTQKDDGWNKNAALNKAIQASKTDYLIFIDGDCVLHPRFVEFHLLLAEEQSILAGKRIKLDSESSAMLLDSRLKPEAMNGYVLKNFKRIKNRGAGFVEEGIFIDPKSIWGFIPGMRSMYQLKGCNMSFPKKAIIAINGFDEDYIRPAIGEDIDLGWRFEQAGYKLKSVRNLAVQYHLYHPENWTDQSENIREMNVKKAQNLFVCKNGLRKLS